MRELELRGKLTEHEFRTVRKRLSAVVPGVQNNKTSQFFHFDRGILKVSHMERERKTVVALKIGDETKNNLWEKEVVLQEDSFDKCVTLLETLGYKRHTEVVTQIREDFALNVVTISLKHTKDWGYHFEIETMLSDDQNDEEAREMLNQECERFGLKPMSSKELRDFLDSLSR